MQTQKMSLANIKGKLSRAEMKNIMAGSGCPMKCSSEACSGSCKCFHQGTSSEYCGAR